MTLNINKAITASNIVIWLVSVSFLLFQFFLQLSSGLLIGAIMQEQSLSALTAGLLSSSFYYVYTTLQIPVGMLFDRYNIRYLLSFNAFLCSIGCFLFATGHHLSILFCGRLIIGAGSAFAFVGVSRILQHHFPLRSYAFMVGLSETLGFTIAVLGMVSMGSLLNYMGWHYFIAGAGVLGLMIALGCWLYIPSNTPEKQASLLPKKQLLTLVKNKFIWFNGLFVGLEFSVITVFAAMWAVSFLQVKLNCSLQTANNLTSTVLLGAGLSCPIYGWLSTKLKQRKPLIHLSCLGTAFLVLLVLYLPSKHLLFHGLLLFIIGLCCGAYMLAFTISNELAPPDSLSACTGFTNTLGMLSAPILQPIIGYLLDSLSNHSGTYSLINYQYALLIVPIALIMASIFSHFLPEKNQEL